MSVSDYDSMYGFIDRAVIELCNHNPYHAMMVMDECDEELIMKCVTLRGLGNKDSK